MRYFGVLALWGRSARFSPKWPAKRVGGPLIGRPATSGDGVTSAPTRASGGQQEARF
jgi:hypothetical protein